MPQILTVPALAEPLPLALVKSHLRLTHDDEDETLTRLMAAARRVVESRTGLSLVAEGWSLFLDRWPPDGVVPLPRYPVIAVSRVLVHGEEAAAEIDPAHYWLDRASRPCRLVMRAGRALPPPGRAVNGIDIAFTAGFGETAAEVPADLTEAMLLMIGQWYAHRGDEDFAPSLQAAAILHQFREVRL